LRFFGDDSAETGAPLIDNITLDEEVGTASPVPEPGTWLMMSAGVVALITRRMKS
jgi:hypothetical protein